MSLRPRAWLPVLSQPQQPSRSTAATPGDWPSRPRETVEHSVPQQLMALLPDFGSWLLRSVRRDSFADSPVLAVERLRAQPRPVKDADKDTLVGAVLTLSSSLHAALDMLLELLPEDQSRERLGEVLCPTLGQLLSSLHGTLSSFGRSVSPQPSQPCRDPSPLADDLPKTPKSAATPSVRGAAGRQQPPGLERSAVAADTPPGPARVLYSGPRPGSSPGTEKWAEAEGSCNSTPRQSSLANHERQYASPARALQAELRVQAAMHLAIESLEFAEGQLKLVREINRIHGGSRSRPSDRSNVPNRA